MRTIPCPLQQPMERYPENASSGPAFNPPTTVNYTDSTLEPWVDPIDLRIANQRHDEELRRLGISPAGRVRASWNSAKLALRGKLTDRRIERYEKAGFYALDYKEARKKLMEKKHKTQGNWTEVNGRMVYTPQ